MLCLKFWYEKAEVTYKAKVQRLARKVKNKKTRLKYARNLARGNIRPQFRRQTGLVRVTRRR